MDRDLINRKTEIIDQMLVDLLESSRYFMSQYYQDQTQEFIDVGEEGLAFDNLICPYYRDRHKMTPEVEKMISALADMLQVNLPPRNPI